MDGAPQATVAIVTKDRRDTLRDALRATLLQEGDLEVLVVDDGSSDGTADMVRAEFPGVRVQRFDTSAGLVVRRNEAVRLARAPVVVSIDDDAVFTAPDTVLQTLRDFDHPRIAAVAIPYIDVHSGPVEHQRAPISGEPWIGATFRGTAFAVRREEFLALGGFRELIFHQGEEADYTLRMLDAGQLVRYGRAAPIHHFESPTRSRRRMVVYGRRNEILLSFTYLPFPGNVLTAAGTVLMSITRTPWRYHRFTLEGILMGLRDSWRLRSQRRLVSWRTMVLDRRLRRAGGLPLGEVERRLPPLAA
jgi:GT2 family glycosyltransferase